MSTATRPLPVITLKPRRALPFFSRHPWVFASAVGQVAGLPNLGDEVLVRAHEGQFIARGLYNPASNIRVRLYSWSESQPLDDAFWQARIAQAIRLRERLFRDDPALAACRMVFSESDGLSGVIVDRYGDWLVLQWTSAALAQRQAVFVETLRNLLGCRGVWLRTERGIREQEGLEVSDGPLDGEWPPETLPIEEGGLRFQVDLRQGQKTGFYFDQRDNRARLGELVQGGRVLDVCCYSGGFALAAARSGAEVVAVDSSQPALELARRNAEWNGVVDRVSLHCDDAFDFLEAAAAAGERYDAVVLDPPKLARTRGGMERALKAYVRLNRLGLEVLNSDGLLLTCSCSGHVLREDFEQVIAQAALASQRTVQILESRGQSADHPVSPHCLESAYLKCLICRSTTSD